MGEKTLFQDFCDLTLVLTGTIYLCAPSNFFAPKSQPEYPTPSKQQPANTMSENGATPPPAEAANAEHFKIKRSTKLEKLMNAFCERQGKSSNSVRFLFEGSRVQPSDTPDTLEMQDGDQLDVHQEQVGGA